MSQVKRKELVNRLGCGVPRSCSNIFQKEKNNNFFLYKQLLKLKICHIQTPIN
jgi:hypothetical protein